MLGTVFPLVETVMAQELVEIPSNIEVRVDDKKVSVKGPLGEIRRDFSHAPVSLRLEKGRLMVEAAWPDKKRRAVVGTIRSNIENMVTGVVKGFTVKLKIVFAHFPMSVKVQGDTVVIENFHGERRPRRARIHGNVTVKVDGDDVIVQGVDIGDVTQTAANIQQATLIKKKDPRIFLDGIYVFERRDGV